MGRSALVGCVAILCVGCGPSLRRVQESHVYFERCYAADFDARIPLSEKNACWSAWLEHYTSGQPPERATYARERMYAIEHGESVPRLPGMPDAVVSSRVAPVISGSVEVSEQVVPPSNVDEEEMARPRLRERRERQAPLPRTSNAICAARACEGAWRTCTERCPRDGEACHTACEVEIRACARGCF